MYVVRRSFRNYNQMMLPGSTVEPGDIKRFKTRLKDRDIVEVNAHNFKQWHAYFKGKFGVIITENKAESTAEQPAAKPKESAERVAVKKVVVVKA